MFRQARAERRSPTPTSRARLHAPDADTCVHGDMLDTLVNGRLTQEAFKPLSQLIR